MCLRRLWRPPFLRLPSRIADQREDGYDGAMAEVLQPVTTDQITDLAYYILHRPPALTLHDARPLAPPIGRRYKRAFKRS
jgi:hypothetical protein